MADSGESFFDRHYFLLRRLHSLTGIVPIGAFLLVHLTTNSSVIWGAFNGRAKGDGTAIGRGVETFQHEVSFINNLPLLLLTEIFVLWLPIAFHSVLGVYYAKSGKRNTERYAYQDNWRYTVQRWTGYIGLLFIVYHVGTLRWGWDFLVPGGAQWSHYFASSTLAAALQGSTDGFTAGGVIVSLFYMVGVTSLVFHLANGLWTAAITWGVTVSEAAQKRWGYVCGAIGVGLMGAGWASVFGFAMMVDYDDAQRIEQRMIVEKYGEAKLLELLERYGMERLEDVDADTEAARETRDEIRRIAEAPYPGPAPEFKERDAIGTGPSDE